MTAEGPDGGVLLVLVVLAPAVGSFAAVLADRLPRGEDVIRQRSCCRSCGLRLTWHDVVPLLSWGLLRGRCRGCAAPIPLGLLQAEVAALVLALAVAAVAASTAQALLAMAFVWCLLALALCDLWHFRLPDVLTGALFVLGLGLAVAGDGTGWPPLPDRVTAALAGAAAGSGAFWCLRLAYRRLRLREGMGEGDVKLMLGIGAALGVAGVPLVALVAGLSGLASALLLARRRGRRLRAGQRLPFGAFLSLAAAMVWVFSRAVG